MSQNSVKVSPRQLTVMVFRDNLSARTFRIPLRWISQFSWLLLLLVLTTAASTGVAIRYYLRGSSSGRWNNLNPGKVSDLENQLKEAQSQIQALSAKTVTPNSEVAPVVDPSAVSLSSPITSKPFLFKGLPDQIQAPPTSESSIPIAMSSPVITWDDKMLRVKFNLEYISSTPGGQQGRLIILARGQGALFTHPNDIIQPADSDYLLNPNKGEYYSVSRFRETKASFGPIASKSMVNEVEVIVLSSTGQMLIHRKISTNSAPPRTTPAPQQTAAAAVSTPVTPVTQTTPAAAPKVVRPYTPKPVPKVTPTETFAPTSQSEPAAQVTPLATPPATPEKTESPKDQTPSGSSQ